ncbi:MAG: hypothetical protein CMB43_04405 [Euryarchaeota archaeon]|nr:hypothetical protein [Euryarchaeota archaeon]
MRFLVGLVLLVLILPCVNVQAHTPNVMMSILKEEGPVPADIVEAAGFVEGDGVKFKMSDTANNSSMRVSIDLDRDGVFNESSDYFSSWMVYDCQYDANGTLLDPDCVESVVFYFNGTNGSGTYNYQIEKMVNDSHTNFWINTIFVGLDNHEEPGLPSVGECFGAGCEEVGDSSVGEENESRKYISILMVISAVGLIGVAISLILEKPEYEEKQYLEQE